MPMSNCPGFPPRCNLNISCADGIKPRCFKRKSIFPGCRRYFCPRSCCGRHSHDFIFPDPTISASRFSTGIVLTWQITHVTYHLRRLHINRGNMREWITAARHADTSVRHVNHDYCTARHDNALRSRDSFPSRLSSIPIHFDYHRHGYDCTR